MVRSATIAVGVGGLIVVFISAVATGDPANDLQTEALAATSTTTTPPTTTAAAATSSTTETIRRSSPRTTEIGPWPNDRWVTTPPTTAVPTTTGVPSPAPVRIPRPTCAANLGAPVDQTAPFTGLSASIPAGLPAVLVKVSNNNSKSRAALIGLDQADIVFEERIEASATRFAAVFHSRLPDNVGPVRSGRTTDIAIMRNLGTPVLGYSGSNNGVAQQLRDAATSGWLVPYINTDRAPFARDGRYSAPDNLFVDPASLGACGNGGTPGSIFARGAATSTTAVSASSVSMQARSPYRFDWNAGTQRWMRSQDGWAHTTRTGAALAPTNVVVLFVRYVPSAIDSASVDAETMGTGAAWVLRDGTITVGSWSRPSGPAPYTLVDGAGVASTLAPGSTWVVLAPAGSASWN